MPQIGGLPINNTGPAPTPGPSIQHNIGQLFGHALNALPGYSPLGANITNPKVNYLGVPNPGFANSAQPKQVQANTGAAPPPATPLSTVPASTGTPTPDYSAFGQLYDTQIGNMQNQYDAIPAYQNEATNSINTQYTPQFNTLETQHASGNANLDLAQNQLDTTHSQGLRNLGNNLRSALNGYQNQIGVMGAGNSSAAPMIGYALAQQGSRQTADMNTQHDQQQTGLNLQRHDLEANYHNQMDTLNSWRDTNLNDIAARYSQSQQQLQSQILGATGDKARYLAMYGQTALANQAIAQMQGLAQQYSDQVGQLNTHFQQAHAPGSDISQYTGQRNINPITGSDLSPLNFQNNQATDNTQFGAPSLTKKPDQSPNIGLGL